MLITQLTNFPQPFTLHHKPYTSLLYLSTMAKAGSESPMMQQHKAIKQKYPDAILLFRVGDFYETFGKDAINAAAVLGITLTKRNNGNAQI